MRFVVDTNVPIAANGRNTHADPQCQLACLEFLESLVSSKSKSKVVILDETGMIVDEYSRFLYHKGQPGVGDVFFKYIHDHMYAGERIELVRIQPNEITGFDNLPENNIDPGDRKFLSTAIEGQAEIVNAVDTDWHEQKDFLAELVKVRQLCPQHGCAVA